MTKKKVSMDDLAALKLKYYEMAQQGILLESEQQLLSEQPGLLSTQQDEMEVADHSEGLSSGLSITYTLEPIITGLEYPVGMAFSENFIFVIEKNIGIISLYDLNGNFHVDLNPNVSMSDGSERGLLGLALEPYFDINLQTDSLANLYLNYTNVEGDTVVSRFTVSQSGDALAINPNSW